MTTSSTDKKKSVHLITLLTETNLNNLFSGLKTHIMRYHILLLVVFQTWSMVVSAQKAIGIPRIISYSKEAYRAGTQDRSGRMYFA